MLQSGPSLMIKLCVPSTVPDSPSSHSNARTSPVAISTSKCGLNPVQREKESLHNRGFRPVLVTRNLSAVYSRTQRAEDMPRCEPLSGPHALHIRAALRTKGVARPRCQRRNRARGYANDIPPFRKAVGHAQKEGNHNLTARKKPLVV